jgi:hypothetical protein
VSDPEINTYEQTRGALQTYAAGTVKAKLFDNTFVYDEADTSVIGDLTGSVGSAITVTGSAWSTDDDAWTADDLLFESVTAPSVAAVVLYDNASGKLLLAVTFDDDAAAGDIPIAWPDGTLFKLDEAPTLPSGSPLDEVPELVSPGTKREVTVDENGILDHHVFLLGPAPEGWNPLTDKPAVIVWPSPDRVALTERAQIMSLPGVPSGGSIWNDPTPLAATLNLSIVVNVWYGSGFPTPGTKDYSGTPFDGVAEVDGVSVPLDVTGTYTDDGDGYDALAGDIVAKLVAAGCTADPVLGTITSSTTGVSSSVTITNPGSGDPIGLSAAVATPGYLGTAGGFGANNNGGLGAFSLGGYTGYYDQDEWLIVGGIGTHTHTSNAHPVQRTATCRPIPSSVTGGYPMWLPTEWPMRFEMIEFTPNDDANFEGTPTHMFGDELLHRFEELDVTLNGGPIPELP